MSKSAIYVMQYLQNILKRGFEYVGLFYSDYRAYVVDVNDPQNMGRIRVMVPAISKDDPIPGWAWPKGMFSSNGYGSRVLPRRGDVVWVSFELGNPKKPLWMHGHFAKGELPDKFQDPNIRFFQSPAGHYVSIDDTNGVIKISLRGGKLIEINEGGISLGSENSSAEPASKADTLVNKLTELIDLLIASKVKTAYGPQGIMEPWSIQLNDLKETLDEIKSKHITLD